MRISFERGAPSTAAQLVGGGLGVTAHTYSLQWWFGWAIFVFGFAVFVQGIRWDQNPWWRALPKIPNPFHRRSSLYTGIIIVSDSELDTKHYLDLTIRAFNGTPHLFQTATIEGSIKVDFSPVAGGSSRDGFVLGAPLLYFESEKPHKPDAEFTLATRLFLSPQQVAEFRKQQAEDYQAQLMFQDLKVELETRRGRKMRLPLWDGVSLRGSRIALLTGRVHVARISAGVAVSASIG
jgi:hypothetical protein